MEGVLALRVPRPQVSPVPGLAVSPGGLCVLFPWGLVRIGRRQLRRGADGQGAAAPRRDEEAGPVRQGTGLRGARAWFNARRGCLEILTISNQRLRVLWAPQVTELILVPLGEPLLWGAGAQGGP